MKVTYSLCFDGQVIESSSELELRRIARNTECYWEMYKHIVPNTRGGGNQKLTILDMREMYSMHEDGIDPKAIAREFCISLDYTKRIIKQMRLEKLKLKTA